MKKLIAFIVCVDLLGSLFAAETSLLIFGQPVTATLHAGEVRPYELKLNAGQFVRIRIKQETVGIGYMVYAPGDSLLEYTDLNALYQQEIITIAATKTGTYRIEIFWDYGRPQQGNYTIHWDKSENTGKTAAAYAAQLMRSWYDSDGPGAAVIVVKNKKVVYKEVKGMANMEFNIPVTDTTRFELGSVSKQFTAYAIALLAHKKKLALTDDIRSYLPELPDFGKPITIANLVYHTSGLRNWDDMSNAMGDRMDDVLTPDRILKMTKTYKYLNFNPGESFSYCNTGYSLLALIIERVSGQSFARFLQQEIFQPLGMYHSIVREGLQTLIPGKAYCYRSSASGYQPFADNIVAPGPSSVAASIADLVKWVNNYGTGAVGGQPVLALVNQVGKLNNDTTITYSFGNFNSRYLGIEKIDHLGLVSGYRASIARFPSQDLSVIYLSSDANDATFKRADLIADIFLEGIKHGKLKPVVLPDTSAYMLRTSPLFPIRDTALAEYEGIYFAGELNTAFTFKVIDSALTIIMPRRDNIYLKRDAPDKFSALQPDFQRRLEFRRDTTGKLQGFFLTTTGRGVLFTKLR